MKKILIVATMTLHLKPLIPLLIAHGNSNKIYIYSNLRNQMTYFTNLNKKIINEPTKVNIINYEAMFWIAKLIGLKNEFLKINKNKIKFVNKFQSKFIKFDYIIGTTKSLKFMKKYFSNENIFFVGYQHMPVYGQVIKEESNKGSNNKQIFEKHNYFINHQFSQILSKTNLYLGGFLHIDHLKLSNESKKDNVFFFHPGGWRKIFTNYGDNKIECYKKQKEKITKLLIPLIETDKKIIIKCHPLAAKFHQKKDLIHIVSCIKKEININNEILIIDTIAEQIKYLNSSKIIFTFGSSSIFELWCLGLKNIKVISFFSNERSQQFIDFKDLYIESYDKYVSTLNNLNNNKNIDNKYSNNLNELFSFYNNNNSNLLKQFMNFIDKHQKN